MVLFQCTHILFDVEQKEMNNFQIINVESLHFEGISFYGCQNNRRAFIFVDYKLIPNLFVDAHIVCSW